MATVFRDADTIARADDGTFLLLFEDTPETGVYSSPAEAIMAMDRSESDPLPFSMARMSRTLGRRRLSSATVWPAKENGY